MINTAQHQFKGLFALGGAILAICLVTLLGSPAGAKASESNYCYGSTLGNHGRCVGAFRNMNALYGQGTQNSVCIWASYLADGSGVVGGTTCSSGPAPAGTYNNKMIEAGFYPTIENNGAINNTVYGIVFKP